MAAIDDVLNKLQGVRRSGPTTVARCPAHDDSVQSLSVSVGDDDRVLLHCHAGCSVEKVVAELGLELADLFPPKAPPARAVTEYPYVDEHGKVLYVIERRAGKKFVARAPNPGGGWEWRLNGVRRVPYRLPEVLEGVAADRWVLVAEGEKDVDALRGRGFVATCNSGGAGKWRREFSAHFAGAKVAVIGDNDHVGRKHAEQVARWLSEVATTVRIVDLPGLPEHGDVSDWLQGGGTDLELKALIEGGTEWVRSDDEDDVVIAGDFGRDRSQSDRTTSGSRSSGAGDQPIVVDPPGDPMPNARRFVTEHYDHREHHQLVHHGGSFKHWDGTCWPEVDDRALRAAVYKTFDGTAYEVLVKGEVELRPFQPTMRKVADLVDALRAVVHVATSTTAPAWLGGPEDLPAAEIVSCSNGLLHVPTRTLLPHTPRFFVHHSVPFPFKPDAPAPTRWMRFLDELWGDDEDSKLALQEMFGYLVAGDTSQQKIFGLLGPRRSGKGTIARVLTGLIGRHNVAGPTISGLATNFGLQELIGKPVAIVSDARLRSDQAVLTERLLSISGEDTLTIDRKYKDPWTGRLPVRFLILTNELPRLNDSSGALASRFILLQFTKSFYGQENTALTDELLAERPGILNWSLDGFESLRARGRFVQPTSAAEALRELEDLGSPIAAFVRDRCVKGPHEGAVDVLYQAWRRWCAEAGIDKPGDKATFGKDLRAAVPGLKIRQPRDDEQRRARYYIGIGLNGADNG